MIVRCPRCRASCRADENCVFGSRHSVECQACALVFTVEDGGGHCTRNATDGEVSPGKTAAGIPPRVKTVLVVDDSRFFREMIAEILEPLRVNLLRASNGAEALDVIKQKRPDLVLLDLNLPQKNGFDVIREVRSNPAIDDICVLAMSGVYHKEVDAAEAKKVGANDFIKKSIKPEELQRLVKMWLAW